MKVTQAIAEVGEDRDAPSASARGHTDGAVPRAGGDRAGHAITAAARRAAARAGRGALKGVGISVDVFLTERRGALGYGRDGYTSRGLRQLVWQL